MQHGRDNIYSDSDVVGCRVSNEDIELLIESVPEAMLVITDEGEITYANKKVENLFGLSPKKILKSNVGSLVGQIVDPSYTFQRKNFFKKIKQLKAGESRKLYGICKNGSEFPVDIVLGPLHLQDKILIWVCIRGNTEKSKKPAPEKFTYSYARSLIEAALDPLCTINRQGKITDVNEALVRMTGTPREKLIDTDFCDYFTEPQKAREAYQKIFINGFVADCPLTIRHNMRDVLYNASVYSDEEGNVLGGFAAARDITSLKKQEKEILALNEELKLRILELESFSYSVSHDLRAPLRAIDGFIAIFLKRYFSKVDKEGQRLLNNVRVNVGKMSNLIDELLAFSRIGMQDMQVVTINMTALANSALEELRRQKRGASVTIKDLGMAKGDVMLIKQVLVNLLSNAFKYSAKTEKPRIEIGTYSSYNDQITYYVKDNGVGFDMEYSNKLFGVFQRLHDNAEFQGHGVGLAIVKRIIDRHEGNIWAEGKEGKGATFYFSLQRGGWK